MPINLRALPVALVLAGLISAPLYAATQPDNATEVLLRGAKKWVAKDRSDLARPLLQKVLLIEPGSPEALSLLGQIELKHGKTSDALGYLHTLEQSAPTNPHTRELSNAYRLSNGGTPAPSSKSAPVQASVQARNKPVQAATSPDRLAELATQANEPGQLALAIKGYEELSGQRGVDTQRLQQDWRRSLHRLPENSDQQAAIRRFLTVYPNDKEMIALLGDTQKNRSEQNAIAKKINKIKAVKTAQKPRNMQLAQSANPQQRERERLQREAEQPQVPGRTNSSAPTESSPSPGVSETPASSALDADIIKRTDALDALDDGNIEVAEASLTDLLTRRPRDPEVVGGLGLVKLKQGKHDLAAARFEEALALDREGSSSEKWKSLIITAKFWKDMRQADNLLEENRLSEAETVIRHALAMQPDELNAQALLANIKAANNELPEAERLYRKVLAEEGHNVSALRGLTSLLTRTQRNDEALALIEHAIQAYPNEWRKDPGSQAGLLREEADLYIAAHRTSHAIQALEMAVLLDPKNPWARFSLAKLYIGLNLAPLARQIMQEGVALSPKDPTMHYVHALLQLNMDDDTGALNSFAQIPDADLTKPMRETRNRALIQYYFRQAESRLAQGNRKEAMRIMSIAETQSRGNYSATEQVAEGWFKLGQQKQGLSAMRKLPQPAPLKTQVYFASLLNRASKDRELTEFLPSLHIPEGMDETNQKYRTTIQEIELSMAGRQFDSLMKAGKKDQAQQLADTVLNANQLSSADYFKYHRTYFSRADLPDSAIPLLIQEKEQSPNDLSIRWDLAYAYYQDKQNSNAQRELQELLALTRGDDIDMRMRIANLQQNLGDNAGARSTINDLIERNPNNTDLLLHAARLAQSEGKYNRAMSYYAQTKEAAGKPQSADAPAVTATEPAAPPDILLNLLPAKTLQDTRSSAVAIPALVSTPESDRIYRAALASDVSREKYQPNNNAAIAEREMGEIAARRSAKIEAGIDIQSKNSNSGTSTYNATEIPVMARFPIGYEAHGTLQIDQVNIDSGPLSSAFNEAAKFGKIQALQFVPAQPLTAKASGTSIGVGYEQGSVKADIGMVGSGFLVSNIVGGIRKGGDFGRMSYSLNLSRRPYTGSLVSYAGAKDPITGAVWGGVTNTGLSLYMSTTLNTFNVAGLVSYGLLRGKNVQNNDRLYMRLAVDNDIYTSDDTVLNVGLAANFTRFSKNESFYTFGHGGYYSPQSSLSFGLPIELYGRADLLSYQAVASVSYARTREDAAPFYPTDPALQASANAGPMFPSGYTQAVYAGGSGGGIGYGLRGAAEYRVTPNFALGGRFSMDRSAYYAPNSVLMYLRYMFNPETGPVKMRPEPVTPYSQY